MFKMQVFFISITVLGLAIAKPHLRVVGGKDTGIHLYPYMSRLEFKRYDIWILRCGGSLITTTSILTAAHCYEYHDFHPPNVHHWRANHGSTYDNGSIHLISEFIVHEKYNQPVQFENDIMVVRLAKAAVLSSSINLVDIASPGYYLADNSPVTVVGWGRLWLNGPNSKALQEIQIYTVNQDLCIQRYAHAKMQPDFQPWADSDSKSHVTENMLCSGVLDVGGKSMCQGDSGGPLVDKSGGFDVVVGIVSWSYYCGFPAYPDVYTRVSNYIDWIQINTGEEIHVV